MGNRCATIVQLTPSPLVQRVPEYLNMLSHNYLQSRTQGDMQTTETRQKRKTKRKRLFFWDKETKLKRHDTRGLCKCNLSASEGHCRHIYSLCHEETYFSNACGITSYQRLSPVTESFPQQRNKIVSLYAIPSIIRLFFNVKFHYWCT